MKSGGYIYIYIFSINLLIVYRESVNLIGYITRRLSADNGFLVSKETVVLRRWGRSKQKFGFIKRVDKC